MGAQVLTRFTRGITMRVRRKGGISNIMGQNTLKIFAASLKINLRPQLCRLYVEIEPLIALAEYAMNFVSWRWL